MTTRTFELADGTYARWKSGESKISHYPRKPGRGVRPDREIELMTPPAAIDVKGIVESRLGEVRNQEIG